MSRGWIIDEFDRRFGEDAVNQWLDAESDAERRLNPAEFIIAKSEHSRQGRRSRFELLYLEWCAVLSIVVWIGFRTVLCVMSDGVADDYHYAAAVTREFIVVGESLDQRRFADGEVTYGSIKFT